MVMRMNKGDDGEDYCDDADGDGDDDDEDNDGDDDHGGHENGMDDDDDDSCGDDDYDYYGCSGGDDDDDNDGDDEKLGLLFWPSRISSRMYFELCASGQGCMNV